MNFFDWMSKMTRKKRLQTYDEYWRRLCQYFELFAHRRVNDDVHKQMRRAYRGYNDWKLCDGQCSYEGTKRAFFYDVNNVNVG